MSRYYVTTPIYYVNDVPHLGTAYTTIATDALRRYHTMRGDTTRMLTGTDEHGLKLEREALQRGIPIEQFVRQMSERFAAAWPKLEVKADDFIRTTEPRHEERVQHLWRMIDAKGDLELGSYEGWYCVGCESYKTEKDLLPGNICPLHPLQKTVEWLKEETYFFKLSRYADRLLEHYRTHPAFIEPESRRNEVIRFVEGGLKDLSVSRTSLSWGIPVPGNPKHVMFVWFDALANYWTALQDTEEHKAFWSADSTIIHLVGKDILRFHAVYWPAFLMSAGLPLPTTVFAHGFLTFGGQKMSKSLRNAVDPLGIARAFGEATGGGDAAGAEVLRYQLLRAISFGQDGDFDLPAMIERYNADLGKNLGNLLARTLGLCVKMTAGSVPPRGERTALEDDLVDVVGAHWREALAAWDAIEPHRALERTWAIASAANQYVDRAAPWAEDKKGNRGRVDAILSTLLEVLGQLSLLIWPVLPSKSDAMRAQIGLPAVAPRAGVDAMSGPLGARQAGEPLSPGAPLFPTIDDEGARTLLGAVLPPAQAADRADLPAEGGDAVARVAAGLADAVAGVADAGARGPVSLVSPAETPSAGSAVSYDEFASVDLRAGVVRTCERVPKKDKLLKLGVDLGEPALRTIIAGLALSFSPEALVGRTVVVVANLAPRDFGKGLVSHGMLLATGPSEKLTLATLDGPVAPGARLK